MIKNIILILALFTLQGCSISMVNRICKDPDGKIIPCNTGILDTNIDYFDNR